jgi:hypothetical protein
MNVLTIKEKATFNAMFTPRILMQHTLIPFAHHFEHYTNPMVCPVTGETISSNKKLMHDPATAEIWQTAFGKDFRGMAQGDNKTSQKGTNAIFVMTHEAIQHVLRAGKKIIYANPVVDLTRKRRMQTIFESPLEEIESTTMRNYWSPQRTLSQQNSIGTVS